jgi:hypothetical protein
MHLKEIISALMLSDFYFNLPLWERKQVVFRLWSLYGAKVPVASKLSYTLKNTPQSLEGSCPKV